MKGADQCPKCGSRKWGDVEQPVTDFYARSIRVCVNCGTAWEPFDEADLLDDGHRYSSFKEPCNNCAFRPGSQEQRDTEKWKELIAQLSFDAEKGIFQSHRFYCHKGVPLDLEYKTPSDSGFAYPYTDDGNPIVAKLRPCRGHRNSTVRTSTPKPWCTGFLELAEGSGACGMIAFEWLGTILQAGGALLLAMNLATSRYAFPVMLAGALIWAGVALLTGNYPLATLNAVFSCINIIGIARWLCPPPRAVSKSEGSTS